MRKPLLVAACVLAAVVQIGVFAGVLHFLLGRYGARLGRSDARAPRAMMRDDDAPRPIQPSLALQVNEGLEATVFAGTPLWFTVGVNNAAAANELAAARVPSARLDRMAANDPGREALRAAYERRRAPAAIALGDGAHPWTAAVQFVVRDAQGGERPLSVPLRVLGSAPGTAQLDAATSVQAIFGAPSANAPAGSYSVAACLGATGSWKGRVCSQAVRFTAVELPSSLTREQENALDRQGGRFGFLARDPQLLDKFGRKMAAADPGSVSGNMYLGEAAYLRGQWDEALKGFMAARAEFRRRNPAAPEPSRLLDARIGQLMERHQ